MQEIRDLRIESLQINLEEEKGLQVGERRKQF